MVHPTTSHGYRDCGKGCRMQHVPELLPEHFVICSKSVVLECRCGEKLVLLGREADWQKEGRTVFECGGCGEKLALDDISKRGARV